MTLRATSRENSGVGRAALLDRRRQRTRPRPPSAPLRVTVKADQSDHITTRAGALDSVWVRLDCTSSGTEGRANVSSPDGYASLRAVSSGAGLLSSRCTIATIVGVIVRSLR